MIAFVRRVLQGLMILSASQGGPWVEAGLWGQSPDSTAIIRGQVLEHETGRPLRAAAVSLASGPEGTRGIGTRITGENGGFLFQEAPAGLYRLSVTLLGYQDLRDTLRVEPGVDLELVLPLSVSPVSLDPIVVVGRRRPPGPMAGFESRRRTLGGTFFTRDDIERRNPHQFTDLLRMVPGARVVPVSPFGHGVLFRGRCIPGVWVDGMRVINTLDLDTFLQPGDMEAVEVYTGAQLPVEFGPSPCGAIVVWTRRGEPDPSPNSLLRQLIIAVGFVTLAWLLAG
ncbi:MAG: carboxypeptidase regulatory-like domain-containing protein [Longimicrobiales bacterium]